ncbi:MAG: aldo/keto reductase [Pseudomonadota bacterium]
MTVNRRLVLKAGLAMGALLPTQTAWAERQSSSLLMRRVSGLNEDIPIVGLGSWITFNVGNDTQLLDESTKVIAAFLEGGGRMIDSSPMYGSSQQTIGYALRKLNQHQTVFSADKVWTSSQSNGPIQMEQTRRNWGVERFDLMQVHNLVNWEGHLDTLGAMKADGKLRSIGITTSHGSRHQTLEKIMASRPIDFVQLTYNVVDRDVEQRLLPLARERGIGVIVNRPYRRGALLQRFEKQPLPSWVADTRAKNWAQFLLKFVISHPAVTCAIPATTRVDHVRENLAAAQGELPDADMRKRMLDYIGTL